MQEQTSLSPTSLAPAPAVEEGDVLLVITRRLFDNDVRRHFVGRVVGRSGSCVRLDGYAFVFDSSSSRFVKRPDRRHRLFDVGDSGHVVNVLPRTVSPDEVRYQVDGGGSLVVTDGDRFRLDMAEFGLSS